ncbi:hypothetical protein EDC96DRAFT_575808 [Choanephora cucurbitarum]|nr:hypothetical protein EDC96DRAFT_575808 [Choanephora cucurbitarum]
MLLLVAALSAAQNQDDNRSETQCEYLNEVIYCFFGRKFYGALTSSPSNDVISLNLTNASGKPVSTLRSRLNIVYPDMTGVNTTYRISPQWAGMGDGRRIFFNGGLSFGALLEDQTIVYDALDQKWSKYEPYNNSFTGQTQIFAGSAVQVPGKGIALFGGFSLASAEAESITPANFSEDTPVKIIKTGFDETVFFDINNLTNPWYETRITPSVQGVLWSHQVSVYDPVLQRILFIGGKILDPNFNGGTFIPLPLSTAIVFDTTNNSWTQIELIGMPSNRSRFRHTLTLAPSTNRDVIMYGGESDLGDVSTEYCFTLDLDSNTWSRVYISKSNNFALSRSRHSGNFPVKELLEEQPMILIQFILLAVLVSNNTLIIMWGINTNKNGVNSILILDITDPYQIRSLDKFPRTSNVSTNSTPKAEKDDNNEELSAAAKGGISVACIIVGFAIIAFFLWNRKRSKKNKSSNKDSDTLASSKSQGIISMEVDWDKVEEECTKFLSTDIPRYHSPNEISAVGTVSPNLVGHEGIGNQRFSHESKTMLSHPRDIISFHPQSSSSSITKPDVGKD